MSGINPGPAVTTSANLLAQLGSTNNGSIFYAPTASGDTSGATDTAAINATAVACAAAGGGIVRLSSGLFYLNASLLFQQGVVYEGASVGFGNGTFPANPTVRPTYGTVLIAAAGTSFPIFWDGKSARTGAYATAAAMTANYIAGCGVKNVLCIGGSYGIKAGDFYEASIMYAFIENVYTFQCAQGFFFENADTCVFRNLFATEYTVGSHWHVSSGTTLINLGDSLCENFLYSNQTLGTNLTRNAIFGSRGGSTQNGICLTRIGGVNQTNGTFNSNTVTIPGSGSSITMTSGTTALLGVGMPITFSSNPSGTRSAQAGSGVTSLKQQQIYFVQSIVDSTHFTLSDNPFGAAMTFSGSGSGTMVSRGYAGLEITPLDSNSSNAITGMTVINAGCESGGGTQYLIANCTGSGGPCDIQLLNSLSASTGVTNTQQTFQAIVARNNATGIRLQMPIACNSVDFDYTMQSVTVDGYQSNSYQQGYTGCGVLAANGTQPNGLFLSGVNSGFAQTPLADILRNSSGIIATGQWNTTTNTTGCAGFGSNAMGGAGNWSANQGNFLTFTSGSPFTCTFPTAASVYAGVPVFLCNQGAGTVTVSLATGNFIGTTTTGSYTLATNAVSIIACVQGFGFGPQWVRYL